jgi:DNA modification methylase
VRPRYWSDGRSTLYLGDARRVLAEMPAESAHCIVTSPPYYGLRDYGTPDQIGQEADPDAYVEALRQVFAEARRVLADDGTLWLNLGDCYTANSDGWARGNDYNRRQPAVRPKSRLVLPPKNLLGMPWRVAFALQADWILRNAVVWHKPNAMPQSVTDRLSTRYELIFLFVKQRHYWFDLDPIREPYTGDRTLERRAHKGGNKPNTIQTPWPPPSGKYADTEVPPGGKNHGAAMLPTGRRHDAVHERGRNPGDVWSISTRPLREAHFAAFPLDLPLRCIAAGCRPGGTVLDPFAGAGTTGIAARQLDRQFHGIELVPAYCEITKARLRAEALRADRREAGGD